MKHTNTPCVQNITAGGTYSCHRASKGCVTFLCVPMVCFYDSVTILCAVCLWWYYWCPTKWKEFVTTGWHLDADVTPGFAWRHWRQSQGACQNSLYHGRDKATALPIRSLSVGISLYDTSAPPGSHRPRTIFSFPSTRNHFVVSEGNIRRVWVAVWTPPRCSNTDTRKLDIVFSVCAVTSP